MAVPENIAWPSARSLFKSSLKDFRRHIKATTAIISIVAVPVALLTLLSAQDTGNLESYTIPANFFMNLALLWAAVALVQKKNITVRQAYYQGTSSAVRFFLVSMVLALTLIPFLLGVAILTISLVPGSGASTVERSIYGALWLLFALLSLYLIARTLFALFTVVTTNARPGEAIRESWRMTKGHARKVMARLLFLSLVVFLVAAAVGVGLGLALKSFEALATVLSTFIVSLAVLPLSYFYLYHLYRREA